MLPTRGPPPQRNVCFIGLARLAGSQIAHLKLQSASGVQSEFTWARRKNEREKKNDCGSSGCTELACCALANLSIHQLMAQSEHPAVGVCFVKMKKMNDRELVKEKFLFPVLVLKSNATFGQRKRWKSESMSV